MALIHHRWERCGRTFRYDDDPTRFVYKSRVGQINVLDGTKYVPYKWDAVSKTLTFGGGKIVLSTDGIEFYNEKKLLFTGTFDPETNNGGEYEKDQEATVGGLTVTSTQYKEKPVEEIKLSYFVQSPKQLVEVDITAGGSRRITFGYKVTNKLQTALNSRIMFNTTITEAGNDIVAKIRNRHGEIISQPVVGRQFEGHSLRWTKEEEPDHSVSTRNGNTVVSILEKRYSGKETKALSPTTWGATGASDDGYDYNGTNFYSDNAGQIHVGQFSSGTSEPVNAGMTWSNVTASGTANDGCHITLYSASRKKTPSADIRVVNARDNAAWSAANLPVNATFHTGTVDWTNIGDGATDQSPELKTLIQERFSGSHQSGDEIAICFLRDAANPGYARANWSSTEGGSPAALTIDYTASAGGGNHRVILISKLGTILPMGVLWALVNNPPLNKRELFNPINWIKKQ